MKVALYARVSTDEQAKHGLSIDAQIAALRTWANREGHYIAGEYIDAGISGKRPPAKRPELSRFFSDLENGLDVDVFVFTKLDRFFRSVKLYYQAMDVLDRHNVAWQAIQENYETISANGRLKLHLLLAVSEQEADRTSERIKAVFDRKIEKGEAITRCQPFGYEVREKKVVPNEYAQAAREMFTMFAETGNTYAVRDMIQNKYGVRLNYESVYRFLQNPIYTGRYRDNPNYCEPIISKELFDRVQADFAERRKTKKAPTGRIYLFSGLIVCSECGRRMTASPGNKECRHPELYRCPGHLFGHTCTNRKNTTEYMIEQTLLQIISEALEGETRRYKVAQKEKPSVNKAAVKQKLNRLKELYIDGDITKDEYTTQKKSLEKSIKDETPTKKAPPFITVAGKDFLLHYNSFNKEQKRSFWRSVIDHITIDKAGNIDVFFIP